MTDLNKERELELFNAFVEKNLPELFEKHSNGNFFAKVTYDSMFGAWLGAKAQAVPDTHVLLPKEPNDEIIASMKLTWWESDCAHIMKTSVAKSIYTGILKASESGAEG
ncbi:TPA: hypothetical protein ACGA4J_001363 [Acinetobacter baumannii]